MLANEKLYEMKVPNNIVLNPKDGSLQPALVPYRPKQYLQS